jgi:parallel beta-helix repeat protein
MKKLIIIMICLLMILPIFSTTIGSLTQSIDLKEGTINYYDIQYGRQTQYVEEVTNYRYIRDVRNECITKERISQYPDNPCIYEISTLSNNHLISSKPSTKGLYSPHDPIDIRGDADFTPKNGVTSGNGTIDDPYIIEGWEIVTTTEKAILVVQTSAYFIVRNCYLQTGSESYCALRFYELEHGRADHVNISTKTQGVEIWDSSDVILSNLTISGGFVSIDIEHHSHHIDIKDSALVSSDRGIRPFNAHHIEISNVTTQAISTGIHLVTSHYTTITDCNFSGNNHGIEIIASGYVTMHNTSMYNNKIGLYIGGLIGYRDYDHNIDSSNTINSDPIYYYRNQSNLVIDGSGGIGFLGFIECDNITVKNYHCSNSGNGIIMAGSRDSQIIQSSFSDNINGIDIAYSENILVSDCVSDNTVGSGIMLINSQHCKLRNNSIINSPEYTFEVFGNQHQVDNFVHDIDTSNTIDGQPILYLVGEKNVRITKNTNFAYLAFVNCKNAQVVNVKFKPYLSQGILLVNTTGIIRGCTVNFNIYGFQVVHCSGLWIINCVTRGCHHGFELWDLTGVKIIGCRTTVCDDGFYIDTCSKLFMMGCNTFYNGYQGINLYDSWDNIMFKNRFTDNQWGGIIFREGCHENEICYNTMVSCQRGIGIYYYGWGQNIHHNSINRNDFVAIDLYESMNNTITHNNLKNSEYGILVAFDINSQIEHNNIEGNDEGMVVAYCCANVSNNWWGSSDGPSGIGPGSGDILRLTDATAYYEPWLEKEVRVKQNGWIYLILILLNII